MTERDIFEAEYRRLFLHEAQPFDYLFKKTSTGKYLRGEMEMCWAIWQAARAAGAVVPGLDAACAH